MVGVEVGIVVAVVGGGAIAVVAVAGGWACDVVFFPFDSSSFTH